MNPQLTLKHDGSFEIVSLKSVKRLSPEPDKTCIRYNLFSLVKGETQWNVQFMIFPSLRDSLKSLCCIIDRCGQSLRNFSYLKIFLLQVDAVEQTKFLSLL